MEIPNNNNCYAGVDLGGTKIALALGTSSGKIHAKTTSDTPAEESPEMVLGTIAEMLYRLEKSSGVNARSIGFGLPGLVDLVTGTSLFLPNLPGNWRGIPVSAILRSQTSRDVYLLNDARMAALGEQVFGQARVKNLLVLTLGTGIGGGVVIEGKLCLGPFGGAGEIGHQTMESDGPLCHCGNRGCLEALASGFALSARGVDLMREGKAPQLFELTDGDPARVNPRRMAEAAQQGDEAVRAAITNAARLIGTGIANSIAITGIERVVLVGGLTGLGDLLLAPIRATVRDRIRMFPSEGIEISFSGLGDEVAVLGGIALAAQRDLEESYERELRICGHRQDDRSLAAESVPDSRRTRRRMHSSADL
jgi:glucokinase